MPGDPAQVVYVWFDALANYITALGYGGGGGLYERWWRASDERLHVIGKGILRFHAVYWPAILLSAGEPLPSAIFVHDYLTVNGQKLSKSLGNTIDPAVIVERYGADALRWWLLREPPRVGDADFREERLVARGNELADELGNLVNRTVSLVRRHRPEGLPADGEAPPSAGALLQALRGLRAGVDRGLADFDFGRALGAPWRVVAEANRFVSAARPWELARAERAGDPGAGAELDAVLAALDRTCAHLASELGPFLPAGAARIARVLNEADPRHGRVLFPKLATAGGGR